MSITIMAKPKVELKPRGKLPKNVRRNQHVCFFAPSVIESNDLKFGFGAGLLFGLSIAGFTVAIVGQFVG